MCEVNLINQLLVGRCLFNGCRVDSMKILYDGLFQPRVIVHVNLTENGQ